VTSNERGKDRFGLQHISVVISAGFRTNEALC